MELLLIPIIQNRKLNLSQIGLEFRPVSFWLSILISMDKKLDSCSQNLRSTSGKIKSSDLTALAGFSESKPSQEHPVSLPYSEIVHCTPNHRALQSEELLALFNSAASSPLATATCSQRQSCPDGSFSTALGLPKE